MIGMWQSLDDNYYRINVAEWRQQVKLLLGILQRHPMAMCGCEKMLSEVHPTPTQPKRSSVYLYVTFIELLNFLDGATSYSIMRSTVMVMVGPHELSTAALLILRVLHADTQWASPLTHFISGLPSPMTPRMPW